MIKINSGLKTNYIFVLILIINITLTTAMPVPSRDTLKTNKKIKEYGGGWNTHEREESATHLFMTGLILLASDYLIFDHLIERDEEVKNRYRREIIAVMVISAGWWTVENLFFQ